MYKFIILAALTFATPVLAMEQTSATELTPDTVFGTTLQDVQSKLTDMGYDVRKSEMEDGVIEVYFVKDGKMGEVYVSMVTGKITKLKIK